MKISHWQLLLPGALLSACLATAALAAPGSATVAGNLQSELGCLGDWQPECTITHLTKVGNEWVGTFNIPAGTWEYKIALDDNWSESYGYGGGSANAQFTLASAKDVTFRYDEVTHLVSDNALGDLDAQPEAVTIAGDLQQAAGCSSNWDPSCTQTQLQFDSIGRVWKKTLNLPAGTYQFKAALNGGWSENYGKNAVAGGDNIALQLAAATAVTFYYSHKTHWVTSNNNSVIATAVGDFQQALGCPGNWAPDCLRTWLQDVDGNGLYTFSTTALPVGSYQAKVALNENWNESYGDNGNNIAFNVTAPNQKIVFTYDAANRKVYVGDELNAGDLNSAKAYWLARDTIAMRLPNDVAATAQVALHFAPNGELTSSPTGVAGGDSINLNYDPAGLSEAIKTKYRHLQNLPAYKISQADLEKIPAILKQQIAVSAVNANGNLIDATALQFAGAIDDLFSYSGALGVVYKAGVPSVNLWAPTAKSVKLHVYDDATSTSELAQIELSQNATTGVWSAIGDASWDRKYYLYEVEVFMRATGKVERNWVTDPYSLALSTNSKRSMFVNLDDKDLQPQDWQTLRKPDLKAPEDAVIYELHVRDFSIADNSVDPEQRGTFAAFTEKNSNGMKHLKNLADAGLTHVHLLPAFDCATVNEVKAEQQIVTDNLTHYAPDSEAQQAAVEAIRARDGFNWCYDPFHYTVPDGGYATNAEGVTRIKEFRAMVAGLNKAGLRVVMDVVYNHTSGSGLSDTSVLDKVVPNYYHRLNAQGNIEKSTCCENTASENTMMEKLMLDSIKTWAIQYKVDGFRYDIMGHHTKDNIVKIKNEVQKLNTTNGRVDGRKIYFYGEGWNFGEVANDALFTQATIGNMSGTGIGTFNDRIRDAIRGGGCCDSGFDLVRNQGFITGLYLDPNAENSANTDALNNLLWQEDRLKVVLAGSLANYRFVDRNGATITGAQLDGTGYTLDPQESINYIEAHDNETLFDIIQYKAPLDTSMADRVRMQNLGTSFVLLAQGVPFLHAGQELLRSKSMDRNSYDAGDWFNAMDFSFQQNGWGKGLPLAQDNQQSWAMIKPRLANPALAPTPADIQRAREATIELLKIRKSSPLFRLETAAQINEQVHFYNTGVAHTPGLVVMSLHAAGKNDANKERILVLFNANTSAKTIVIPELKAKHFNLHSVQKSSTDRIVRQSSVNNSTGAFTVPARTTAVFVAGKQGNK